MGSCSRGSRFESGSPVVGIIRLGALAEGVKYGVSREDVAADRALSLLRERLDDEGESGTCNEWELDIFASVLTPPTSLALRRRARSLCSLKSLRSAPREATASGNRGTTKLEGGTVTVSGRPWLAGRGDDRLAMVLLPGCLWRGASVCCTVHAPTPAVLCIAAALRTGSRHSCVASAGAVSV